MDNIGHAFVQAGLLPVVEGVIEDDILTGITPDAAMEVQAVLAGETGEYLAQAVARQDDEGVYVPWFLVLNLNGEIADLDNPAHLETVKADGLWYAYPEVVAEVEGTFGLWMHVAQPPGTPFTQPLHLALYPEGATEEEMLTVGFNIMAERLAGETPPLLTVPWDAGVIGAIAGEVGE